MNKHNNKSKKQSIGSSEGDSSNIGSHSAVTLGYQKPVLISYGDVRDITLGGSPGVGESGATNVLIMLP